MGWHTEEFGSRGTKFTFDSNDQVSKRRLYYYQEALNSIYELVKNTRELIPQPLTSGKLATNDYYLNFPSPTIAGMNLIQSYEKVGSPPLPTELISNGYSLTHWKPEINYAFQKVFQLSKYRGFDPFFRPLQDGDILDRHHFRIFAFRKMSSSLNDFAMTSKTFHKADFEPLFTEMGARKAEAYVEALVATLEELDGLRDNAGKIKQISEQDIINALKHNYGAEWRSVYDRMVEKNHGDLTDSITEWNSRGTKIETKGYLGYLKSDFNSAYTKDLDLVKKITLAKILDLQGVIGSRDDFIQLDKYLPGILKSGILKDFVRLTKFI